MQTSLSDAIRTWLGRFSKYYETLDKLNCFYILVGHWNYTLKSL